MVADAPTESIQKQVGQLQRTVSRCESALKEKEAQLIQQFELLEERLIHQLNDHAREQRRGLRAALSNLLTSMSDEEVKRLELERGHELRAKRAELAWREKLLQLHSVVESELQRASEEHRRQLEGAQDEMLRRLDSAAITAQLETGHVTFEELTKVAKKHASAVEDLKSAHASYESSLQDLRGRTLRIEGFFSSRLEALDGQVEELCANFQESEANTEAAIARIRVEALHDIDRAITEMNERCSSRKQERVDDLTRLASAAVAVRDAAALREEALPPRDWLRAPNGDDQTSDDVNVENALSAIRDLSCIDTPQGGAHEKTLESRLVAPVLLAHRTIQRASALSERLQKIEKDPAAFHVEAKSTVDQAEKLAAELEKKVEIFSRTIKKMAEKRDEALLKARAEVSEAREQLQMERNARFAAEEELQVVKAQLDAARKR